jgi:hypothetical protein
VRAGGGGAGGEEAKYVRRAVQNARRRRRRFNVGCGVLNNPPCQALEVREVRVERVARGPHGVGIGLRRLQRGVSGVGGK